MTEAWTMNISLCIHLACLQVNKLVWWLLWGVFRLSSEMMHCTNSRLGLHHHCCLSRNTLGTRPCQLGCMSLVWSWSNTPLSDGAELTEEQQDAWTDWAVGTERQDTCWQLVVLGALSKSSVARKSNELSKIRHWNVLGALYNPEGIPLNTNKPNGMQKATFALPEWLSHIRTQTFFILLWWVPYWTTLDSTVTQPTICTLPSICSSPVI